MVAARSRRDWFRRPGLFGVAVSVLVHGVVILAVIAARYGPPRPPEPQPIAVQLVDLKPLPDAVTTPWTSTLTATPNRPGRLSQSRLDRAATMLD